MTKGAAVSDDATKLRARASRCRQLATEQLSSGDASMMLRFAEDLERDATALDDAEALRAKR
jgi:hypothetical protein